MEQWSDPKKQEQEQERPIPPYTKATAIKPFKAQHAHDLPFSCGDQLTILEPCNVIFWYLAEDAQGRRGVIPINFVRLDRSVDGHSAAPRLPPKPPPPLPPRSPSPPLRSPSPPLRSPPPPLRSPPPPLRSPPSVPHKVTSPKNQRPKPSPQTIPRSSASGLHSLLCHTSSEERLTGDSASARPPPTPPKSPRTLKPYPLPPPPPHPRTVSPSEAAAAMTRRTHLDGSASGDKPRAVPIDIDSRPPAPLPAEALMQENSTPLPSSSRGKYPTLQEFMDRSGWFQPSVEAVLCRKANLQVPVFKTMTCGIYIFKHRNLSFANKKYVGKSRNLYSDMVRMLNKLYEKPESKLNPIELELKYHFPDADNWHVKFQAVLNTENLGVEHAKCIAKFRSVQPEGLNLALEFHSQEEWYAFATWYRQFLNVQARLKAEKTTPAGVTVYAKKL